jgi:hypothetical protein
MEGSMTAPPRDPYAWVSTDSLFGCPVVVDPDMPPNVIRIVNPGVGPAPEFMAELSRVTREALLPGLRRRRVALDAAVRALRRDNPMRWPCACIGCVVTIRANFQALWKEQA